QAELIFVEHTLTRGLLRPHRYASRRVESLQVTFGNAPSKQLAHQSERAVGLNRSATIMNCIEEPHDVDFGYKVCAVIAQDWENVELQHALVLGPRALLHLAMALDEGIAWLPNSGATAARRAGLEWIVAIDDHGTQPKCVLPGTCQRNRWVGAE